jgi:hypothetical protein
MTTKVLAATFARACDPSRDGVLFWAAMAVGVLALFFGG